MVPERLKPTLRTANELARLFEAAGAHLYLVGGAVRDALADRLAPGGDLDFTTDALPSRTEEILAPWADSIWAQGKRFGTIGAAKARQRIEVTTHRAERYGASSRKPEVAFSTALEADLSRRDFTVNAMALSLPGLALVDPLNGVADLAAKRLRTPLAPEESFADDPLRMLRAARFIAAYELDPEPELFAAVTRLRGRLDIISDERVRDELDKLIVAPDPSAGLWFLVRTGLAEEFLPELPALALEQDPAHRHKDVLAHTIAVVARARPERTVRLAALFHDIGKPKTRSFGPGGTVSFHHHELVGARMTRDRMKALRYPTGDIEKVSKLVELHLRFHTYGMGWTDSAVRRYVRDVGDLLGPLNELTRSDSTTRNLARARELAARMDELERRVAELAEREELAAIRPDMDGRDVMAHLGLAPGPLVGRALAYLLELRLEEGPHERGEATRLLDEWWASQPEARRPGGT
ncbi:MAG: CCA tRNA nucleotidyltransferase [Acidimicrobiales bacterium]